jgi:hypothetical protein
MTDVTQAFPVPDPGQWVRVTTDWSLIGPGICLGSGQARSHVGLVTYVSEEGIGFEMTTGEAGGFVLREILMARVRALEVLLGEYAPGPHQRGIAEAATRESDAARKKATREKREGMFR